MTYIVTPLGQQLADPATIQAFETPVVNANMLLLENGIIADRVRLTPLEALPPALGTPTLYARGQLADYLVVDLTALDAVATATIGDTAWMTTPGTGIDAFRWRAYAGTAGGLDWQPDEMVISDTKAHLDTFIAAVAAIADTRFQIGKLAFVTGTKRIYRFTSAAGAYLFDGPMVVPVRPTGVAGTGVALNADGSVDCTTSTAISLLGIGSADFDVLEFEMLGAGTAGATISVRVRTGGADIATSTYSYAIVETTPATGPTRFGSASDTSAQVARTDNGQGRALIRVTNLFAALATIFTGLSDDAITTHRDSGGRNSNGTSYPDLSILIASGTWTGKINIRGIAKLS